MSERNYSKDYVRGYQDGYMDGSKDEKWGMQFMGMPVVYVPELPPNTLVVSTLGADEVAEALCVVNDAANDARHRGDYARANALVRARIVLFQASKRGES